VETDLTAVQASAFSCGPVDQPGILTVVRPRIARLAGPPSGDPVCGKALTLLRRAAGSNPARSTMRLRLSRFRDRPPGLDNFADRDLGIGFQLAKSDPYFERPFRYSLQNVISGGSSQSCFGIGFRGSFSIIGSTRDFRCSYSRFEPPGPSLNCRIPKNPRSRNSSSLAYRSPLLTAAWRMVFPGCEESQAMD
jgi:hypothetical protein